MDISSAVIPHSTTPRPSMIKYCHVSFPLFFSFLFLEMSIKSCHYRQLSAWPWPSKFKFPYCFPDVTVDFTVIGSGTEVVALVALRIMARIGMHDSS